MGTCQPTLPKCEIMHTRDTVPQCSVDRPEVYAGIGQEAKPSFRRKSARLASQNGQRLKTFDKSQPFW
eukprot:jgi/Botrbrau1/19586/Bobra.0035s0069.1